MTQKGLINVSDSLIYLYITLYIVINKLKNEKAENERAYKKKYGNDDKDDFDYLDNDTTNTQQAIPKLETNIFFNNNTNQQKDYTYDNSAFTSKQQITKVNNELDSLLLDENNHNKNNNDSSNTINSVAANKEKQKYRDNQVHTNANQQNAKKNIDFDSDFLVNKSGSNNNRVRSALKVLEEESSTANKESNNTNKSRFNYNGASPSFSSSNTNNEFNNALGGSMFQSRRRINNNVNSSQTTSASNARYGGKTTTSEDMLIGESSYKGGNNDGGLNTNDSLFGIPSRRSHKFK